MPDGTTMRDEVVREIQAIFAARLQLPAPAPETELLESGVHLTVNVPQRAASDAPLGVDLVLLSVTETQVAPGWASSLLPASSTAPPAHSTCAWR